MGNEPQTSGAVLPNPEDAASNVPASDPSHQDVKSDKPNDIAPPPPRFQPSLNTPNDYFSRNHSTLTHETNPFEAQFGGGGSGTPNGNGENATPGGTKLPSVAALTSPAGMLGAATPSFWGGLRSGPLSPAMLSGPQKDDYFNDAHHLHRGFPTPNESGLRSGLTPGGGGSMFPEPSPGAIFNVMASTPGTIDFHRTAMTAASLAAPKREQPMLNQPNITSQPQEMSMPNGAEVKPGRGQFDATDAANGLYLLANARNEPQQPVTYTMAPQQQMPVHAHPPNIQMGGQPNNTSPQMGHRQHGSISTQDSGDFKEEGSEEPQSRPSTRGNGKRKRNDTSTAQSNGSGGNGARKTNGKASNKKAKNNNNNGPPSPGSDVGELDLSKEEYNTDGKKMTDEEKRKNFLERNRVAALKCRQRKKQWLANLQQKVEMYAAENENLMAQCDSLKAECVNLKTLLVAHKDCPVAAQQGLGGMSMHQVMDNYRPALDPYQMAQNGQPNGHHGGQQMPPQDFGRRYS